LFAGVEMSEVSLRGRPEVRRTAWRQAEKIPEAAQHVPHARTLLKAVNKEAYQNVPNAGVEAVVPTACLSTGPWHNGLYNYLKRLPGDPDGYDGDATRHHLGNSARHLL
jgi:hypothetical protein